MWRLPVGAELSDGETLFRVWAPLHKDVILKITDADAVNDDARKYAMEQDEKGYFQITAKAEAGSLYQYIVNGVARPDPASRYQPQGVHGKSCVVPSEYEWSDQDWKGLKDKPLIYELHVGAFADTFSGVESKLEYLKELGVNMIELMPVAQYGGSRNWGYDGVLPYAVQHSYGGPNGLKRLVNNAHSAELGVVLDVVYNHLGYEGNVLADFAPYFSTRYRTPWGSAFNLDEAWCDEVRNYIVWNALYWVYEYHIDGLRLDAVHSIFDMSPKHVVRQISDAVHEASTKLGRRVWVIAESDLNDPKVVDRETYCGWGADAQWADDLHHAIHAYVTGENNGYYADFGGIDRLLKALSNPYVYDGVYSVYRRRFHGSKLDKFDPGEFVVYTQNHDQVGNRPRGERLISLVGEQKALAAAGLVLFSAYTPMIFMGEEYGESSPFLFFTDFSDPEIVAGLRQGRLKELGADYYDPQDMETFERSRLTWKLNNTVLEFYRRALSFRRSWLETGNAKPSVRAEGKAVLLSRNGTLMIAVFGSTRLSAEKGWRLEFASNNSFPPNLDAEFVVSEGCAVYMQNADNERGG
ncbi:MAG: malto-oligosyltrehalose trehalohydrolase [Thermoprotei archaeon]